MVPCNIKVDHSQIKYNAARTLVGCKNHLVGARGKTENSKRRQTMKSFEHIESKMVSKA